MKQIDQDPGDYRYQKPDGSWAYRVNKPLCRWLGVVGLAFGAMSAIAPGSGSMSAVATGLACFAAGCLITLSLKSID